MPPKRKRKVTNIEEAWWETHPEWERKSWLHEGGKHEGHITHPTFQYDIKKQWFKHETSLPNFQQFLSKRLNLKQMQQVLNKIGYTKITDDIFLRRSTKGTGSYVVRIAGSKDNPNLAVSYAHIGQESQKMTDSESVAYIQEINQIMRRMRNLARKPPKGA